MNKAMGKQTLLVLAVIAVNELADSKGYGIGSLLAKAGI